MKWLLQVPARSVIARNCVFKIKTNKRQTSGRSGLEKQDSEVLCFTY